MPGPDNLFVLTESITKGRRDGLAISCGLVSGVMIHTLAASTGLSFILQQSAIAFSVLKYMGAAYLFYLAYQSFKEGKHEISAERVFVTERKSFFQLMRKGFTMNLLNPKVSLFFIAFLPQFITKNGWDVTWQMIMLGVLFMIQGLFFFVLIVLLSSQLAVYVNSNKFWKITKWGKIGVLSFLAVSLALSKK